MKTDDQESRADDDVSLWIWGASIVVVMFVWATFTFWIDVGAGEQKFDRGTFGDMFGAVNALFSGLALATLFYTVFLQRKELKETRKELSDQRDQMEIQAEIFRKQAFEDTFFRLLEQQRKMSDEAVAIRQDPSQNPLIEKLIRGRDCFVDYFTIFQSNYRQHYTDLGIADPDEHALRAAYFLGLKTSHKAYLPRYFAALCRLLRFIENNGHENAAFYRALVRDQLSIEELLVLCYVCIGRGVEGEDAELFIAGEVFLDLDPSLLIRKSHAQYFRPKSFNS